jgi:hypothetical protein
MKNNLDILFLLTNSSLLLWIDTEIYLYIQAFYYFIQLADHRKYLLHHLITINYFSICSPEPYLALGVALFQFITALILLAKERKSVVLFAIGIGAWFSARLIAHGLFIIYYFDNLDTLSKLFNIAIYVFGVYYFIAILAKALRYEDGRKIALYLLGLRP